MWMQWRHTPAPQNSVSRWHHLGGPRVQTWQGKLGAARRVPPPGLSDPGHLVRVPRLSRFSEIKCTSVLLAQPSDSVSLPTASSQSFPPTTRIRPEAAARETTSEATCSCRSQHSRKVTGARFHREAPTPGLRQARDASSGPPLSHPEETGRRTEVNTDAGSLGSSRATSELGCRSPAHALSKRKAVEPGGHRTQGGGHAWPCPIPSPAGPSPLSLSTWTNDSPPGWLCPPRDMGQCLEPFKCHNGAGGRGEAY